MGMLGYIYYGYIGTVEKKMETSDVKDHPGSKFQRFIFQRLGAFSSLGRIESAL